MNKLLLITFCTLLFAIGCKKDSKKQEEAEQIVIPPDPSETMPVTGVTEPGTPNSAIIYRKLNMRVGYSKHVFLDVDADGVSDFNFFSVLIYHDAKPHMYLSVTPKTVRGSRVMVKKEEPFLINGQWAYPLEKDFLVQDQNAQNMVWTESQVKGYISASSKTTNSEEYFGLWIDKADKYLGIKFKLDNKYHYGWVKISHDKIADELIITEYAYSATPEQGIISGKTE